MQCNNLSQNSENTIMLIKAKSLKGNTLECIDGEIGKVIEFYFDDQHWTIRYLVAGTGSWLTGRQVLISPYALGFPIISDHHLSVNLTKKQIENSPSLDTDKPVSRQFEMDYSDYYGWPLYWGGPYMWGAYPNLVLDSSQWKTHQDKVKAWDPHLCSTDAVRGHHVHAADGNIGHVEDFIIDSENWSIRYLDVDTHNWWPGKRVLISPQWINCVSWDEETVFVNLHRDTIQQAPEFNGDIPITRDYEERLHAHYQRNGYWIDSSQQSKFDTAYANCP